MVNIRMKLALKILPFACVCFIAACTAEQKEPSDRTVPAELRDPSGMLTVRPGGIDRCESKEGLIAVEVSWDATAARTNGVQVFLQDKGGERKLWSADGALGKSTTGIWMRDGSVITLVNGENGAQLGQVVLKDVPCG